MAVTQVGTAYVLLEGADGGQSDLKNGTASYKRNYAVDFTDSTATLADAVGATGIPAKFAVDSEGLRVSNRDGERDKDNPCHWVVTVTWTLPQLGDKQEKPEDKTKWNVEISGDYVAYEVETHQTVDSTPKTIVNTNGEPIDPALTRTRYDQTIKVRYRVYAPDWSTIDSCIGCANSESISLVINGSARTFATHTLKLDGCSFSIEYQTDNTIAVLIDLTFIYRKDTWTNSVPNMSYYQLNSSDELIPILDGNQQPVSTPSYLDADGNVLDVGDDAYLLQFETVEDVSFSSLLTEIET